MVSGLMNITDILNYLDEFGVFAYVLPFLLIFAVIFGILEKGHILGNNRGVHVTIAFAVGLLSLQFDYVSDFFATIFPYAGIGLAIVLVALILMGLIAKDDNDKIKYIWFGVGVVAFIAVLWASLDEFSFFWMRGVGNLGNLVPVILVVVGLGAFIWWMWYSGNESKGGGNNTTQTTTVAPRTH